VQNYIEKLNLLTGKNYRLPTEAEWEYAAKGGVKGNNFKYSGSNDLNTIAWCEGNSGNKTHPVGAKKSNELGVFDMSGNVWEWCSDWRGSYSVNHEINPIGPLTEECKVLRGGQITSYEEDCSNTYRICSEPATHDFRIGFRLVLPVGN
jgi:formylglycine-generating enzyme required for sulfatase activity